MDKTCRDCKESKPLAPEFWTRDKTQGDGFRKNCKVCYNAWARGYAKHKGTHVRDEELSEEARERRIELRRKYRVTHRANKIKRWHEKNGAEIPTCACGCGEQLKFDTKGDLHRYRFNHFGTSKEYRVFVSEFMTRWHQDKIDTDDYIGIEKFREVCRKIKADKGWTWKEMARAGGISYDHMNQLMTHRKTHSVRHETATNFLRRIVGLPTPPSAFLRRERKLDLVADAGMDKDIWDGKEEQVYRDRNRVREQLRRLRESRSN